MHERRMSRLVLVSVIAAAVTLAGAEAFAATCTTSKTLSTQSCCSWKTTSSGVKYCALWCTGSEICDNMMNGLGSAASGCTGDSCPAVSCAAFGTVPTDTSGDCGGTSLDILNPSCGIQGIAYCKNKAGNSGSAQGQPFTLTGVEQASAAITNCDKKGNCSKSLKLLPTDTSNVCINPNWQFVTFTASAFKGKACFCPGGYAADKTTCCADNSRNTDGTCVNVYAAGVPLTEGTPICITTHCTLDLSTYNPTTNFNLPYQCPNTKTCGGITGDPCPQQPQP